MADTGESTQSFIGGLTDIVSPGAVIDIIKELNRARSGVMAVENETQHTLRLRHETIEHDHGGFAAPPSDEIPPGGRDTFGAVSSANSIATGYEGRMVYDVVGTTETWMVEWNGPFIGTNEADSQVVGPNQDEYRSTHIAGAGDTEAEYRYTLRTEGGGGGGETPPTTPPTTEPGTDVGSSCHVTVVNQTDAPLQLIDQGHAYGEFMTLPGPQLPAGETGTFVSVETAGGDVEGCGGFVIYETADGTQIALRWDNPEQGDNSTEVTIDGPSAALFQVLDQVGAGEQNVPVMFTITGQAAPVVPPEVEPPEVEPPEVVPPEVEPPEVEPVEPAEVYVPPAQADEPTLRLHDEGVDGWVEYLQDMLNQWPYGPLLEPDGNFGGQTHEAVFNFQRERGLQVDGIVGHQTWASLQDEAARPPSTDGRVPHTYEEQGPEARWWREGNAHYYVPEEDNLVVMATNTGNVELSPGDFTAPTFLTLPSGEQQQIDLELSAPSPPEELAFFEYRGILGIGGGSGTYQLTAYMPQELGGDNISGDFEVP